jgi:hypothetical protein
MFKVMGLAAAAVLGMIGGASATMQTPVSPGDHRAAINIADDPPRASKTGRTKRSATATKKGANQKNFCPPGQKRKPGKGSAFKC